MVIGIVDERDVDPVQAEAVQARLQAAQDAVGAEVEPPDVAGGHGEALGVAVGRADGASGVGMARRAAGLEQAADLGGDDVVIARAVPQRVAEAALGQAEAVVRRGVEGPDPAVPGRVDGGPGVVVAHLGEQVPDRRAAEGQLGDVDRRPAEAAQRKRGLRRCRGSRSGHERGLIRRPAMPPSTASAVPVTDDASGLAR